MPFAVDPDRPLARSLARVARGLIAVARDSLAHAPDDPVSAVHDARRDIRTSRAVLRLMRYAVGDDAYHEQHDLLRRAARVLSEHRDAHVIAAAMDRLTEGDAARWAPLREAVGDAPGVADQSLAMAGASALLELERYEGAVECWPRAGEGLDSLVLDGFAHTLRRARTRVRRASEDPNPENLHELRKRSKDVRDQLRVLMPCSPRRFAKLERRFDDVTDLLGEGRDLFLLAGRLGSLAQSRADLAGLAAELRERAVARQEDLEGRALCAAAEIKAPPKKTARRLLPG